ncbi:MAG TPA: beta-ketoacyl synthase N-terminal-like domain-containing protein, partial [Ktedonobacteraceae bacterium]|nr:beta-ketoacyl synthase N-terminal-like domain-containing protein [Ktedonobacteraceae bacterium]
MFQQVQRQLSQPISALQERLAESQPRIRAFNAFLAKIVWVQLQSLGMFRARITTAVELAGYLRSPERYGRWLDRSLAVLVDEGYLAVLGSTYTVLDQTLYHPEILWSQWEASKTDWLQESALQAQIPLLEATLHALPDILSGKVEATASVFPHASLQLVERVYKENPVLASFNTMMARAVAVCVGERVKHSPNTPLRILEIGAGTGSTSASVFQELEPYRVHIEEYCYTDLSQAFLLHARQTYAEVPYVRYQVINVEEPLTDQGIGAGSYDLVIAGNVLHATRNIRQTLRNVKTALAKHGLLLASEVGNHTLFEHLTFGLLEGWWLYEDPALRMAGGPGLAAETWESVLLSEGFSQLLFPTRTAPEAGQQIILAGSDGLVRQKRALQPSGSLPAPLLQQRQTAVSETSFSASLFPQQVAGETGATSYAEETLRTKSMAYFKRLIGGALKMSPAKIDMAIPLEKYGVDSIMIIQLIEALRKDFAEVSSTLFFEHRTLEELLDYFLATQKQTLVRLAGLDEPQHTEAPIARQPAVPVNSMGRPPFPQTNVPLQDAADALSIRKQDIAVVGLAGRYPQADTLQEFWVNLRDGRDCISEIPRERWDWQAYYDREKGKWGKTYSKWGGFLTEIDCFDPLFFQISPKEAEQMDPQERLFLEVAYNSIEDAGYTPATLDSDGKVGVFVGVMNSNYASGTRYWSIANRLSYLLDFRGPSLAVDTACSSSLTAIHLALE